MQVASSSATARLSHADEIELLRRWRENRDRASFDKLINAHIGAVFSIARRYRNSGQPLEDLVQQGNLGLLAATKKYDPTRNVRFIGYAMHWIRAYIIDYVIANHGPFRWGTTRAQRIMFFGLNRAHRQIAGMGKAPTNNEIARILDIKTCEVEEMTPRINMGDMKFDQAYGMRVAGASAVERFADPNAVSPEEWAIQHEEWEHTRVERLFQCLSARERRIMMERSRGVPLRAIGRKIGISGQRVGQIEIAAIRKIRAYVAMGQGRRRAI